MIYARWVMCPGSHQEEGNSAGDHNEEDLCAHRRIIGHGAKSSDIVLTHSITCSKLRIEGTPPLPLNFLGELGSVVLERDEA